jgi:outer membrane receptor for ferrienterochelin and colicins
MKMDSGYNYRFSYSSGYRNPSIKELYYQWTDHTPHIYGNPNLKSTFNNYLSVSVDKRSDLNDFSVDFYRNDIDNMISTEYDYPTMDTGGLYYKNYDNVIINGANVHYFRRVSKKLNLKFVYNLTDASSASNEILEGISKHSLRLNLMHNIFEKLTMIVNVKYAGEKFNFDQEQDHIGGTSIKKLDDYFISDIYFSSWFKTSIIKFGMKNIFDYKDNSRLGFFAPDVLNNYDPGRRFFVEYNFNFKREK